MALAKESLDLCRSRCLPEFHHVHHYWDRQRNEVIAKILPGEFYMTKDEIFIATTLGSCVSACIWDVRRGIGGMNHFMLPLTDKEAHEVNWGQRGLTTDATRYGNFAMEHLINTIIKYGGLKENLKAKVFGGGQVLKQASTVGERNIAFVLDYLKTEDIEIESEDLGDVHPRKILFQPRTGRALVKRLNILKNDTIVCRESDYRQQINQQDVEGGIELF